VWLPLPHLLMAPLRATTAVANRTRRRLFRPAGCFVLAGAFLFAGRQIDILEPRRRGGRARAARVQPQSSVPAIDAHE